MKRQYQSRFALLTLFVLFSCLRLNAANWLPFGPDGGDARAFASDPNDPSHLYLGTATGWIYESHNGGANWKRLAAVGHRDDLALDSIIVDKLDSKRILVGAWVLGSVDGGLYESKDGGESWHTVPDMQGQSIRAFSVAPSDPKLFIAGTLKGVYRSTDGAEHWQLISPAGSQELHEIESIAIDPVDPQIIYAGTWHLPWKTTDGGQHWSSMKQGIAEDSDVFSIIVDPKTPKVVYASACSGIYKSENGGGLFDRMHAEQGFPSTAHRTRVLMQDPKNQNIVFAGTTEGLYRTVNSGGTWQRTTGPEVIVNDVYVDPSNTNRVMIATDRGGVLASNDGGTSFTPANTGFSARQVTAYLADATRPSILYVGVVNDKTFGGVFVSDNAGLNWSQKSGGLNGQDVFSLGQAPNGTVLAGTRHGLYRLQGEVWARVYDVQVADEDHAVAHVVKRAPVGKAGTAAAKAPVRTAAAKSAKPDTIAFDMSVNAIARLGDSVYAATSDGILRSVTNGETWKQVGGLPKHGWNFIAAAGSKVVAASLNAAVVSSDGGQTWEPIKLPDTLEQVVTVAVDGSGGVWVGGRQGIFISDDRGASWQNLNGLDIRGVTSIFYDEPSQRILITANRQNTAVLTVRMPDKTVHYWNTGWSLRMVRAVGDHLVGATLFDGIVVQPQMVDSNQVLPSATK